MIWAALLTGFSTGAVAGAAYIKWSDRRYWDRKGFCDTCGQLKEDA